MSNSDRIKCEPCEGIGVVLTIEETKELLSAIHSEWQISADYKIIKRRFVFKGFLRTICFVNAVAWIAQQENHHPDISFGFNYCEVQLTTHALAGLSKNDFLCAIKIDKLLT